MTRWHYHHYRDGWLPIMPYTDEGGLANVALRAALLCIYGGGVLVMLRDLEGGEDAA